MRSFSNLPPVSPAGARHPSPVRAMAPIAMALFFGFVSVGLPLPVVPLFVHQVLGYGDIVVGTTVGLQFLATVLTRGHAGSVADAQGGKLSMMRGALTCSGAGALYVIASILPFSPAVALSVLLVGRVLAGVGESQLVTGSVTWMIATGGSAYAGTAMSLTGMAMYASVALSAPLGMVLYEHLGFPSAMTVIVIAPLLACAVGARTPSAFTTPGVRVPMSRVLGTIWRSGLGLLLQGVGFAVISAFASLFFASRGWPHAALAMTLFGGAYALMRVCFGHLPDRMGGYLIAVISLGVECAGQAMLWLSPTETVALGGAFLSGMGCSLLFPALGVEILKHIPAHSRGTALGGFVAFQDIAYGITGPITGVLAARAGYASVFLVGALSALAGIGFVLFERSRSHSHNRLTPSLPERNPAHE
ncbi:arabinose transporter [Pseudomonas sp. NPDC088368]|uniref:arabinose transporter n=1 Tax=Pseudomonas sp. NPDC088368 TaxID=3364453 RepID=UPI003828C065